MSSPFSQEVLKTRNDPLELYPQEIPKEISVDTGAILALSRILEEAGLSEIQYSKGDTSIHLVKWKPSPSSQPVPMVSTPSEPVPSPRVEHPVSNGHVVKSPLVGTAYVASRPGEPPFVKVGDVVKKGQTLLIIEAMKVMNHIKATESGKIVRIDVCNAMPVEYGEELMYIEA